MLGLDWPDEDCVLLYKRDSVDWLSLSWQARGVYALMLRVANRDGQIRVRGWESLARLLHTADVASIHSACVELWGAGFLLVYGDITTPVMVELPEFRASQEPEPLRLRMSNTLRRQVFERDRMQCRYCRSKLALTVDHIMPGSRGGTNELDNLVTACRSCNAKKKDRTPSEAGMFILAIEESAVV